MVLGVEMTGKSFPEPWLVVDLEQKDRSQGLRHLPYFNFMTDPEQPTVSCVQVNSSISPLGHLVRAALHTHTRHFDDARSDLYDAFELATRCGFRLHEADAYLGYARLELAQGHPDAAREHLGKARVIIEATGYHRRDGEVEELEKRLDPRAPTFL